MHDNFVMIVSSPSGAGKTVLCKKLLALECNIVLSVSYTTRKMRSGEVDGQDYVFVSRERFSELVADNYFIESANVLGEFYGTPHEFISQQLGLHNDVILNIDCAGFHSVKKNQSLR